MEARNLSVPKFNTPVTCRSLVLCLSRLFGLSMHSSSFLLSLAVLASATVSTHAQSPIRFPSSASQQTPLVTATTHLPTQEQVVEPSLGRLPPTESFDVVPLTWIFGAIALGRNDIPVVPAVGVIWQPNPGLRFELTLPKPKIAFLLVDNGPRQQWAYLGAGLNGGTWAYQRAGGIDDQVTYGEQRIDPDGNTFSHCLFWQTHRSP